MLRGATTAAATLTVGEPIVVKGHAPHCQRSCVFEDDGTTGYFYALDESVKKDQIRDAVHIYNVVNVVDVSKPSRIEIAWSNSERACALLVNGFVHAIFDFEEQRGYARTGFPVDGGSPGWSVAGHSWSEAALALFADN